MMFRSPPKVNVDVLFDYEADLRQDRRMGLEVHGTRVRWTSNEPLAMVWLGYHLLRSGDYFVVIGIPGSDFSGVITVPELDPDHEYTIHAFGNTKDGRRVELKTVQEIF